MKKKPGHAGPRLHTVPTTNTHMVAERRYDSPRSAAAANRQKDGPERQSGARLAMMPIHREDPHQRWAPGNISRPHGGNAETRQAFANAVISITLTVARPWQLRWRRADSSLHEQPSRPRVVTEHPTAIRGFSCPADTRPVTAHKKSALAKTRMPSSRCKRLTARHPTICRGQ